MDEEWQGTRLKSEVGGRKLEAEWSLNGKKSEVRSWRSEDHSDVRHLNSDLRMGLLATDQESLRKEIDP